MNKKKLNFDEIKDVSGGTYHEYTVDGKTLWAVHNSTTGDWDPGYQTEEEAKIADLKYNGKVEKGSHLGDLSNM